MLFILEVSIEVKMLLTFLSFHVRIKYQGKKHKYLISHTYHLYFSFSKESAFVVYHANFDCSFLVTFCSLPQGKNKPLFLFEALPFFSTFKSLDLKLVIVCP